MTARNVWPISRATDEAHLIACPYCGEGLMRHVGSELTRSLVALRFICTVCEQPAAMLFDLGRTTTRATWEWTR